MKKIILILALIFATESFAAPAGIFKGTFMKLLPNDGIEFKDNKKIVSGALNPVSTAVDAPDGSLYIGSIGLFQKQDAGLTTNWLPLLIGPSGSGTDECVARWDGTGVPILQNSIFCITDLGVGTGLTQLLLDSLSLNGNTVSSTAGNLILDPFDGNINLPDETASRPLKLDASQNIISTQIDLASTNDVTGLLPNVNGGTGNDSSAATGVAHITAGVWSYSSIDLTSDVSGTLPISNGGTSSSTALNNDRQMVSSGGAIVEAAALTDGQMLIGSTGAAPVAAALTGTANQITVTNGAGSSTLSTPQDIATTSSVTFAGATIGVLEIATPFVQSITAVTDTLDSSKSFLEMSSTADFVLTSTPSIAVPSEGHILVIHNSGSFTIDVQDESALPGSEIKLGGAESSIRPEGSMTLIYSEDAGHWSVLSNPNSASAGANATVFGVRNTSGVAISAGKAVYITGWHNGSSRATVDLADADDPAKVASIGITAAAISNNANGDVITSGITNNIDTSTAGVNDGVWLSTTAGGVVFTRPTIDDVQRIGTVARSNVNGQIFVTGAGRVNDVPIVPSFTDYTDANHNHEAVAGGGTISITNATTGTLPTTRGGTGNAAITDDKVIISKAGGITSAANFNFIDASGVLTLTGQSNVDQLRLDGNTLSTTSGDLTLAPTGSTILSGFTQDSVPFIGASGAINEDNTNFTFTDSTDTLAVNGIITVDDMTLDGSTVSTSAATDLTLDPGTTGQVSFDLDGGQLYNWTLDGTSALALQSQTAATASNLTLLSNDGDATDGVGFNIKGSGAPDGANFHSASFQWDVTNTQYELQTGSGGTASEQDLSIFAGAANANQIFLDQSSGNVSIKGSGPTNSLEVNGAISYAGLGVESTNLVSDPDYEDANDPWIHGSGSGVAVTTGGWGNTAYLSLRTGTDHLHDICFDADTYKFTDRKQEVGVFIKTALTDLEYCYYDGTNEDVCDTYTAGLDKWTYIYQRGTSATTEDVCLRLKTATATNLDTDKVYIGEPKFNTAEIASDENVFSARITNSGTPTVENVGKTWITTSDLTDNATGDTTIDFTSLGLAVIPDIQVSTEHAAISTIANITAISTTSVRILTEQPASTDVDANFSITLTRLGADYVDPTTNVITPTNSTAPSKAITSSTSAITSATLTYVGWGSAEFDDDSLFERLGIANNTNWTVASGWVAPRKGYWDVHAQVAPTDADLDVNEAFNLYIYIDGVLANFTKEVYEASLANPESSVSVSSTVFLEKGETVSIGMYHNAGADVVLTNTAGASQFVVKESGASADWAGSPVEQFQTKYLSADVTTDTTMSDLTYSNMTIGNCYNISLKASLYKNALDSNSNVTITHDSGTLDKVAYDPSSGTSTANVRFSASVNFIATATSLTFVSAGMTASDLVQGDGTASETFAQLTEKQCQKVSKW